MADQTYIDAKNLREFMSKMDYFVHNSKPDLVRSEYSNLVTNGGFDADSDWTKGTGWTIGSGVASKATGTASSLTQTKGVVGRYFNVTITSLNRTAGDIFVYFGTNISSPLSTNATVSASGYQAGNGNLSVYATGAYDGDVDNVSLWEADPADDAPWLRLTQGHVFDERSSIWRDDAPLYEGEYEVINRFGQTFIKPLTAPGVNTRFQLFTAPEKRP